MLSIDFLNPETEFRGVADKFLWNDLFLNPFPVDFHQPQKGVVKLSDYFLMEPTTIHTRNGIKLRKLVKPKKTFFQANQNERDNAFLSLTNFLIKYGRPCRDIYVQIKNHPEMDFDPVFSPLCLYFREPQLPSIDYGEKMLSVKFEEKFYPEIYRYTFGPMAKPCSGLRMLLFSFNCFRGFVLQY